MTLGSNWIKSPSKFLPNMGTDMISGVKDLLLSHLYLQMKPFRSLLERRWPRFSTR